MTYPWSESDSKSPQVTITFPSIPANLNNVVWIIFQVSGPCINPLLTVLSASIVTGIRITFMFHCFFSCKFEALISFRSFSVLPCSQPERQSPQFGRVFFLFLLLLFFFLFFFYFYFYFFFTVAGTGHLVRISWFFVSQNSREIGVFNFRDGLLLLLLFLFE